MIAENQPTGQGSVTTTCSNPEAMHYPGGTVPLTSLMFGAETSYGSITASASETWTFRWEPDEGKTIQEDPPVEDVWEIYYRIEVEQLFPYYSSVDGSGTGTVTITADTHTGSYTRTRTYTTSEGTSLPEEDGEEAVTIPILLNGANPSATISLSASGSISGEGF